MNRAAHRRRINAALDRAMRTAERLRGGAATRVTAHQRRAADRAERAVDGRPEPTVFDEFAVYKRQTHAALREYLAAADKQRVRLPTAAEITSELETDAAPADRPMAATEVCLRQARRELDAIIQRQPAGLAPVEVIIREHVRGVMLGTLERIL